MNYRVKRLIVVILITLAVLVIFFCFLIPNEKQFRQQKKKTVWFESHLSEIADLNG